MFPFPSDKLTLAFFVFNSARRSTGEATGIPGAMWAGMGTECRFCFRRPLKAPKQPRQGLPRGGLGTTG